MKKLEKERSEFRTRATMAETQNKALQEHLTKQAQNYQKKIQDLKNQLQSKGVDVSKI